MQRLLERKGYDPEQINQIILASSEDQSILAKLNTDLPSSSFRKCRKLLKDADYLAVEYKEKLINIANNGYDVEKINNDKMLCFDSTKSFLTFINCVENFPEIVEPLYKIDDWKKRDFIYNTYATHKINLLEYKHYKLDCLELIRQALIQDKEISYKIKEYNFDYHQLKYIFSENNIVDEALNESYTAEKMCLINYLVNNKLDYNLVNTYTNKEIELYCDFIKYNYDISKFYDKKYDNEILNYLYNNNVSEKSLDVVNNMLIELETIQEYKRDFTEILYLNNINKNDIKLFVEKFDELDKYNKLPYIIMASRDLNYNRYKNTDDIKITPLLNEKFDYHQAELLKSAIRRNIDVTDVITPQHTIAQMKILIEAVGNKENVDIAKDSSLTIDEMEAIIFYNSKNIFYEDKEEYFKNYMIDKNNEYEIFDKIYSRLNNERHEYFTLISMFVKYNKEHEYQLDINKLLKNSNIYFSLTDFCNDLEDGWDVNVIWGDSFSAPQTEYMKQGLEMGIDLTEQMKKCNSLDEIKELLENVKKTSNEKNIEEER